MTANKRESESAVCRQNKSPASNAAAKQKNVSADADIKKMPNIGQFWRYVTLEHKTSHKSQFCEIEVYASSES